MGLDEAARIALQLDHGRSDNGGSDSPVEAHPSVAAIGPKRRRIKTDGFFSFWLVGIWLVFGTLKSHFFFGHGWMEW